MFLQESGTAWHSKDRRAAGQEPSSSDSEPALAGKRDSRCPPSLQARPRVVQGLASSPVGKAPGPHCQLFIALGDQVTVGIW